MFKTLFLGAALALSMTGAAMAQATVEDLMQADRDFSQLAQDTEVRDAFLAYAARDAIMMNPGQNFIQGEGVAAEYLAQWPDGINLSWEPIGGQIAASGDLGFTYGTYVSRGTDEDGNEVANHGKYVTIWALQDDGSWKWAFDGGNPSPAPDAE